MNKTLEGFKNYLILNGHNSLVYVYHIQRFLKEIYTNTIYTGMYARASTCTPAIHTTSIINSISLTTNTINESVCNAFLMECKKQYSIETTNLYIKSLNTFIKYLGINISIPKLFKTKKILPDYFSLDYLEQKILPAVDIIFEDNKLKYRTLLYFDFFTGIRRGEHYYLKRKHFNFRDRTVKIYAPKTMEERKLPLNDRIVKMLLEYFDSEIEGNNAFNLGKGGVRYFYDTLKPNFDDINLRPQIMRHNYATHCLTNGIDVSEVQQLLGHKNILTTMRYLGNNQIQLWDKFRKNVK